MARTWGEGPFHACWQKLGELAQLFWQKIWQYISECIMCTGSISTLSNIHTCVQGRVCIDVRCGTTCNCRNGDNCDVYQQRRRQQLMECFFTLGIPGCSFKRKRQISDIERCQSY